MEENISSRKTGKTLAAVRLAAEKNVPILCQNEKEAKRVVQIADSVGLRMPAPLVFNPQNKKGNGENLREIISQFWDFDNQ